MSMDVIVVPVDGATNIKLEVLDSATLKTVFSESTETPRTVSDGLEYNATGEEFAWFDSEISSLPADIKEVSVIAPVARGASGGLIGDDNSLIEVPGEDLTLAYTQLYSDDVEKRFAELAGSEEELFLETGTVRAFPGSIALIKRLVFEEMVRPELAEKAAGFAYYGCLMAGHYMDSYKTAWKRCGAEHSYWMCHTGARNVNGAPGTLSALAGKVPLYKKLVPSNQAVAYQALGSVPEKLAQALGIYGKMLVIPGGHDTCLSHIPVMSTYYQAFPDKAGSPVIHVDAGTWTMVAQIGGKADLPADGYKKGIVVQGTVDGEPVVTAMYAGGNDFKYVKGLVEEKGQKFGGDFDEAALKTALESTSCMVLPNVHPDNAGTGPFPDVKGWIINEETFFADGEQAFIKANLATAVTTAVNVDNIATDENAPLVLTAGGSRDPYFGRMLASLTGRTVYGMYDRDGQAVAETTTLGAAITGKAAVEGTHPYKVDTSALGVSYRELEPLPDDLKQALHAYKAVLLKRITEI